MPFLGYREPDRVSVFFLYASLSLLTIAFTLTANGQDLLDQKINLRLKNATYIEALNSIEKAAGIHFIYQTSLFQETGSLTITIRQEKIKDILEKLLQPVAVAYERSYDHYFILKKSNDYTSGQPENNAAKFQQPSPEIKQNVFGNVLSDGKPIAGTSIIIEGTGQGTTADDNGKFILSNVPAGSHTLLITHIGFANLKQRITIVNQDIFLNIILPGDLLELQQLVVTAPGSPKRKIESSVAITTVSAHTLEDRAPLNSADAIKAIPGVFAVSGGGDGPGAVRVRGLPSSGGYQFFGVMEDGLPVLPTGFSSFPSADQNFKIDLTLRTIEAIRGGNGPLVMANTPGALMNNISYTGADTTYGKFKFTTGLSQEMYRVDGNFGGSISRKVKYNIGGFFRTDEGIKPPSYTANKGGQLKANVTYNFNEHGFVRLYTKYINDRVQWLLAGFYPYNRKHKAEALSTFDVYNQTLVPAQTRFDVLLPGGKLNHINLEEGYSTKLGSAGFLFHYRQHGWLIKNNFRYQYNEILGNFPIATGSVAFDSNKKYFYTNGKQLVNPTGFYTTQQLFDNKRLESQLINYLDLTQKTGRHNITLGGGIYVYNVISHEGINAVVKTEISNQPEIILEHSPTASPATAAAKTTPSGHAKYDGVTNIFSVYALDEWAFTNKLSFEAGIRIDRFDLKGTKAVYSGASVANGGNGFSIVGKRPWSDDKTYWSASVAANYKVNNQLAFFIRGTRSYNAFDIADFTAVDFDLAQLKNRTILLTELGTKYTQGNFSLFSSLTYTTGSNLPLNVNIPGASGSLIIQSSFTSSRSFGWEAEATYRLLKGLNMRLISTIQDPVFTDYTFTVDAAARPDIVGKMINWQGNRPQSTPNWSFQLEGSYSYKIWDIFANAIRTGPSWSTSANTYKIPAYTEATAGIKARLFQNKAELRAWSNNLFNSRALTQGNVRGEQFINERDLVPGQLMLGRPLLPRSFWLSAAFVL